MRLQINLFGLIAISVATVFFSGMEGCGKDETPVAFIEAVPEDGSTIQPDETITAIFDGEPIALSVPGTDFSVTGSTVTIVGPFDPGELNLILTWTGGATALTYTVNFPATVVGVVEDDAPEDDAPVDPPRVVPGMNLIVPGKSAAGITLGDPLEKVKKLYGEPANPVDAHFVYRDIGIIFAVNNQNVVETILIEWPNRAKTAGGIGIGSTRQQVENAFGKPDKRPEGLENLLPWVHWYRKKGISFDILGDDKVSAINIKFPF